MDTKLKKYNRARRTGIVITGLAAALFVALFPLFGKIATQYYEAEGRDGLESTEFVEALIRSNYVFYKNVMDKSGSKIYSYEELYMDKTLEENKYIDDYSWENEIRQTVDIGQLSSIPALYAEQIQAEADAIHSWYVDAIGTRMDYYILDKATGASIKNTSLPIEDLLYGSIEDIEAAYEYYIIMDYDRLGNLQNISAKGQDADKLLKLVRSVESSATGRLLTNRYETETFALYDEEVDRITYFLTLRQKKPANAVFVYAVTNEQMQLFKNSGYASAYLGVNFGKHPIIYSYFKAGVNDAFILFLMAIFVITVALALFRPLVLEGAKERKAPIEIVFTIAVIFLVFSGAGYGIPELVANVESGNFLLAVGDILRLILPAQAEYEHISEIIYEIIKYGVSFCVIAFLFSIWYFCCLEVSDIARGVKKYISTRCLTYKYMKKICTYIKTGYHNLKTEIKSADLGKDMNKLIKKLLFINFCLLTFIGFFWVFGIPGLIIYSFALYYIIKKYIKRIRSQYLNLLEAVGSIAQGSLNNTFDEDFGIFESSKEELYEIQNGFKAAVDKEVKSQMMKTELITNVSHDLKTPLTAIITYIDLMKEEDITEEQRKMYLDTLERKSLRLKVLIEDLFEVSKASSGNISLDLLPVDICSLMRQVYLENEDKMKQAGLQVRFTMPDEKVILQLDSQKTYRIFENLYANIIKYALPETRVFITVEKKEQKDGIGSGIHIELKNISAQEIVGDPQYLSERFVRGDASRNTEGSGLGLAIARSFTELQGGTFRIESDGDLFKVILEWGIV